MFPVTDRAFDWTVSGTVVRKAVEKGPVRGIRLRGDLVTVLRRVVEVASDTDREGHVDAPGMLLEGFEVVG